MNICACGLGQLTDVAMFSPEWHRIHKAAHLAVFPDVDQITIDNLDAAITGSADKVSSTGAGTTAPPSLLATPPDRSRGGVS